MVTVGGGNLSVMTCRREPLRKDRPIPKSKCDCDSGYLMASRHLSRSPRGVCLIVQVGRDERQRCPVMKVPMVEPHFQEPRSRHNNNNLPPKFRSNWLRKRKLTFGDMVVVEPMIPEGVFDVEVYDWRRGRKRSR